jgi:hypothetical protein
MEVEVERRRVGLEMFVIILSNCGNVTGRKTDGRIRTGFTTRHILIIVI